MVRVPCGSSNSLAQVQLKVETRTELCTACRGPAADCRATASTTPAPNMSQSDILIFRSILQFEIKGQHFFSLTDFSPSRVCRRNEKYRWYPRAAIQSVTGSPPTPPLSQIGIKLRQSDCISLIVKLFQLHPLSYSPPFIPTSGLSAKPCRSEVLHRLHSANRHLSLTTVLANTITSRAAGVCVVRRVKGEQNR